MCVFLRIQAPLTGHLVLWIFSDCKRLIISGCIMLMPSNSDFVYLDPGRKLAAAGWEMILFLLKVLLSLTAKSTVKQ